MTTIMQATITATTSIEITHAVGQKRTRATGLIPGIAILATTGPAPVER
jgi:hypothetical protein